MELPPGLRNAVEAELAGVSTDALAAASGLLSERYRGEVRDGRLHVADDLVAKAYLAARLPATYAATRAALEAANLRLSDFSPQSLLDLGSGPGTAAFAAADCWPGLARATLVEASAAMRRSAEALAVGDGLVRTWRVEDFAALPPAFEPHDLVTIAYVLDELARESRDRLIASAWRATGGLLVIVEPGTPAGWRRILAARAALIAEGARIVAPCPHEAPCPLAEPDWCHFAVRVARSRLHLRTKQASVPYEDEKYIFLAASRLPPADRPARVLAPPRAASGRVVLKLCLPDGSLAETLVTRREGEAYRLARRAEWGEALALPAPTH